MRRANDLKKSCQRLNIRRDGPETGTGDAVILAWFEGNPPVRRLDAVDATEGGRDSDATTTITAQADGNQTGTDCVCCSRRAPASVVIRIMWVGWCSVVGVVSRGIYNMSVPTR